MTKAEDNGLPAPSHNVPQMLLLLCEFKEVMNWDDRTNHIATLFACLEFYDGLPSRMKEYYPRIVLLCHHMTAMVILFPFFSSIFTALTFYVACKVLLSPNLGYRVQFVS